MPRSGAAVTRSTSGWDGTTLAGRSPARFPVRFRRSGRRERDPPVFGTFRKAQDYPPTFRHNGDPKTLFSRVWEANTSQWLWEAVVGCGSGHSLVVRRDEGGRRSVLFVQVDPVDLRCATHGFELRRHGD